MTVQQVAALAKLAISPAEEKRMEEEFTQMLGLFQQMDIEEDAVPVCDRESCLRTDEVRPCIDRDTLLTLAPERRDEYISVPKSFE